MTAQFYISAAHKSSGKTTLSIGITAALTEQGLRVQNYKKGPDYIDPLWLDKASRSKTYNLDFNTQSHQEILKTFTNHSDNKDVLIVEGNKGLFDGISLDGSDSNAAMARLLNLPVVLVIDCQGISRGIAPLLQGYQHFDPEISYAGVILNKVASSRHESKLRKAVETYTDLTILGAVGRDNQLEIPERHLGLVPANEANDVQERIEYLAQTIRQGVDLRDLVNNTQRTTENMTLSTRHAKTKTSTITVAVPRDPSFGFYYHDDLEAFTNQGVELIFFDALSTPVLPACDGLFIGGGFPETQMQALEANQSLRDSIKQAIRSGLPTYAECGGLMYLCESIRWGSSKHQMVGVIPADIEMQTKPQGRGYAQFTTNDNALWQPGTAGGPIPAHEFHYAQLKPKSALKFAYEVNRGYGIDGQHDAIVMNNLVASFIHLRHTDSSPWVDEFIKFIREKVQS